MALVHALFVLAWALVRTLFSRAIGRPTGLAAFNANYAADRLPAPTPAERALLPKVGGCIACGLCDLDGRGAMELALTASRDSTDSDAAVLGLAVAGLSDATLAEREKLCPTRVPLVELARLTRTRARAIEVPSAGAPRPPS